MQTNNYIKFFGELITNHRSVNAVTGTQGKTRKLIQRATDLKRKPIQKNGFFEGLVIDKKH